MNDDRLRKLRTNSANFDRVPNMLHLSKTRASGNILRNENSIELPKITLNDTTVVGRIQSDSNLKSLNKPNSSKHFQNHRHFSASARHESEPLKQPSKDITSAVSGTFGDALFSEDAYEEQVGSNDDFNQNDMDSLIYSMTDNKKDLPISPEQSNAMLFKLFQTSPNKQSNKRQTLRQKNERSPSMGPNVDRKRLVNQFLGTVKNKSADATRSTERLRRTSHSSTSNSLPSLKKGGGILEDLFDDDESSQTSLEGPLKFESQTSSLEQSLSSSSIRKGNSEVDSQLQISPIKEVSIDRSQSKSPLMFGLENDATINLNETNLSHYKIRTSLVNFEAEIRKTVYSLLVEEKDQFRKSLDDFDTMKSEIKRLEEYSVNLKNSIKKNYAALEKKFDENDQNSFIAKLNQTMTENIDQLMKIEERHEKTKQKVTQQRELIRKLEHVHDIKLDFKSSHSYKQFNKSYLFIVLDVMMFFLVFIALSFIKVFLWN